MFPNARISYGAIGWGPTAYIQNFMVPKYNNVFSNIGALGIYNMPGAYTSLHGHPEWFSSCLLYTSDICLKKIKTPQARKTE